MLCCENTWVVRADGFLRKRWDVHQRMSKEREVGARAPFFKQQLAQRLEMTSQIRILAASSETRGPRWTLSCWPTPTTRTRAPRGQADSTPRYQTPAPCWLELCSENTFFITRRSHLSLAGSIVCSHIVLLSWGCQIPGGRGPCRGQAHRRHSFPGGRASTPWVPAGSLHSSAAPS